MNAALSGATFTLSGLKPATRYYAVAVADGIRTAPIEFTTETAAQIPNGNLDAAVTYSGSGTNYENVVFEGWGTNNAMTTSKGSDLGYCRISGTIAADGASGKCALLRNVGWGSNTAVGDGANGGKCEYVDVGLLHLGSTRSTRPSGFSINDNVTSIKWGLITYKTSTGPLSTDDLDCGIAFASRPGSMSFKYKYQPKNSSDRGYAEITVLDASGNKVASKTVLLSAMTDFKEETVTLDYPANAPKCGKLYVKFMSSYDMEYLKRASANYSGPGSGNLSRGTFMGSQLYIDEVTLNY